MTGLSRYWAVAALEALGAAFALALALAPGGSVPSLLAGVVIVLALPGLGIVVLLFPSRRLDSLETIVIATSMSVAVTVLGALLAFAVGIDLTREVFLIGPFAVAIVCATVAAALPPRAVAQVMRGAFRARRSWRARDIVLLAAALVVTVLAVGVAHRGATTEAEAVAFTELSVRPAGTAAVHVRLKSLNRGGTYRIQVSSGSRREIATRNVRLRSGGSWATDIAAPRGAPSDGEVGIRVFDSRRPRTPIRSAHVALRE